MAKPDPLIRWETEALRESAARRRRMTPDNPDNISLHKKAAWVTLREAHFETGLPIETLRKWARRRHVPSDLRKTEFGERRFVDLAAVEDRARRLGRSISPVPPAQRETPAPKPPPAPKPDSPEVAPTPTIVDLRDQVPPPSDDGEPATETVVATGAEFEAVETDHPELDEQPADRSDLDDADTPTPAASAADEDAPPGTMIVPIAAWDRMLMQLGNLHQAGQQLADARERAAKAETEAKFLRERLAELRADLAPVESPPPQPAEPTTPSSEDEPPEKLWRYVWRGWRARRR